MTLETLRASLPEYAKDLRLNLDAVLGSGAAGLEPRQVAAVAIASAIATRHPALITAIEGEFAEQLDDAERAGARAAAAMMAMTNIYYRFTHLVEDDSYQQMRAGLRMNVMASPGIDKVSFEFASLAVSAINGCGMCMASHEKTLRGHGVEAQAIQSAVKIAAVIHAVGVTLEAEAA